MSPGTPDLIGQRRPIRRAVTTALAAGALAASGLAGAQLGGPAAAKTAPPSKDSVVITAHSSGRGLGKVLTDADGFSLYDFSGDGLDAVTGCLPTNTSSTGTACTSIWPPVLATGPAVGRGAVDDSKLGTIDRPGIGKQVTYDGQPLYRFVADKAPGQTNGQDITSFKGIWRLVSLHGGPAVDRAHIGLELSSSGPVLDYTAGGGATRSVYQLSADAPRTTTCVGGCAAVWPPVLTNGDPKAELGVDGKGLGTLRRPDGTRQVTYFGHPLYLFAFDLGAGAPSGLTNGNDFIDPPASGVWYTTDPDGHAAPGPVTVQSESTAKGAVLATPATVGGGTTATVYTFSTDTPTTSTCTGTCATAWPPLLTSAPPKAGTGADAAKLGTVRRPDGSFQVTYDGHPLYLFSHALDATTAGAGVQAFGGVFQTEVLGG